MESSGIYKAPSQYMCRMRALRLRPLGSHTRVSHFVHIDLLKMQLKWFSGERMTSYCEHGTYCKPTCTPISYTISYTGITTEVPPHSSTCSGLEMKLGYCIWLLATSRHEEGSTAFNVRPHTKLKLYTKSARVKCLPSYTLCSML